jgi:hypothetical protein
MEWADVDLGYNNICEETGCGLIGTAFNVSCMPAANPQSSTQNTTWI